MEKFNPPNQPESPKSPILDNCHKIIEEFSLKHPDVHLQQKKDSIVMYSSAGELMGSVQFIINKNTIISWNFQSSENFREQGVAKTLAAQVILQHPHIASINSELVGTNERLYEDFLEELADPIAAFKKTPAGRIIQQIGFSTIKVLSEIDYQFKSSRPQ